MKEDAESAIKGEEAFEAIVVIIMICFSLSLLFSK